MKKRYQYKGSYYTFMELVEFSNVSRPALRSRLENGWAVEEAVDAPRNHIRPAQQAEGTVIPADEVIIQFTFPVPNVFREMQPVLHKPYAAKRYTPRSRQLSKPFYIIKLESGKPLIVYPGEFIQIGGSEGSGSAA